MTKPADGAWPAWQGPLLIFIGGCFTGMAPIALRYGLDSLGPQAIAFWRYIFALPILLLIVVATEKRLPAKPNKYVAIAGIVFGFYLAIWHWSLTLTSVANATFIISMGNLGAGLTAWIILKDRLTPMWGIAVAIALLGVAGLSLGGAPGGPANLSGDMLAMVSMVLISFYMVVSKAARGTLGGMETIFWLTVFAILVGFPAIFVFGESALPATAFGFAAPFFLALTTQILGQGLIILGLGHTKAGIAGILVVIQPVIAAILSWNLFDEALLPLQIGGAALILLAIYISQRGNGAAASKPSHLGANTSR